MSEDFLALHYLNEFLNKTAFDSVLILFLYMTEQLGYKNALLKYSQKIKKGEFAVKPSSELRFTKFIAVLHEKHAHNLTEPGVNLFSLGGTNNLEELAWKRVLLNKGNISRFNIEEAFVESQDFTVINVRFSEKFYIKKEIQGLVENEMERMSQSGEFMFFNNGKELSFLDKNAKPVFEIFDRGYHVKIYGTVERILIPQKHTAHFFNIWKENFKEG